MMSQHKIWILLILMNILICKTGFSQEKMDRVKVNKYLSMLVPESFTPMSQEELYSKYVSSRLPIAMYTSMDRRIDLGVNESNSPWASSDYEILKSFHKSNILNLFTEVEFIQEDIKEIAGRKYVVFEFVSSVEDENAALGTKSISKYTYIMYTVRNNQVLLFNFTAPAQERPKWHSAAKEIMESIRLKD